MPSYLGETREGFHRWEVFSDEVEEVEEFCERVIGVKNREDSYGVDRHRRIERNVEGYLAEYVACAHYGQPFSWEIIRGRGDTGVDLSYENAGRTITLGVKSVRDYRRRLVVPQADANHDIIPDGFLLCIVDLLFSVVTLRGVISSRRVFNRGLSLLTPRGTPVYVVENHELRAVRPPLREYQT